MVKVCRRLKDLFSIKIYKGLDLQEHRMYSWKSPERHVDLDTILPQLLRTLTSPATPQYLHMVRRLKLRSECSIGRPGVQSNIRHLLTLVSPMLRELSLDGSNIQECGFEKSNYPLLEVLTVTDPKYGDRNIIKLASQPRLRTVGVYSDTADELKGSIVYGATPYMPFDPLTYKHYRAMKGKQITLNVPESDPLFVRDLITKVGNIVSLLIIKDGDECEGVGCEQESISHLDQPLQILCGSLEKLVLIRSRAMYCAHDRTVLAPLRDFVKLRCLRIDAGFLLGNNTCCADRIRDEMGNPVGDEVMQSRPTSALGHLLPQSLQRLDIHVCRGEVTHNPNYPIEVVQSILKPRLKNLAHITVDEMNEFLSRRCTGVCQGRRPLSRFSSSPVTLAAIRNIQNACTAVGIRLIYIKRFDRPSETPNLRNLCTRIYKPGAEPEHREVARKIPGFQLKLLARAEECAKCHGDITERFPGTIGERHIGESQDAHEDLSLCDQASKEDS
ncbi:hypothetical protein H2200_001963 [Cladophialophora chaetospira]|uniref:Uncharacterized protein n=1 Tax=Cladophialophora chaetospira TaxID=386627 RepID=A0AA38XLZ8_9EURO|nr:hypothetical protein H2200_001963 [Cladophialophora chaetospira]